MPDTTPAHPDTRPRTPPEAPSGTDGFGANLALCPTGVCAAGAVRDGAWVVGPSAAMHARESDLASPNARTSPADLLPPDAAPHAAPNTVPGVWIGAIAYDATGVYEPASPVPGFPPDRRNARVDTPASVWHRVLDSAPMNPSETNPGPGSSPGSGGWTATAPVSATGRERFIEQVRRALDYIRAGDIYQVNLTHRLECEFEGDPRAFARDLIAHAQPRHGVYLEYPRMGSGAGAGPAGVVVSVSPERFLRYDAGSRRVSTQPMKGTRPIGADPAELEGSAKDRAELAMIVDLMRNDLGRVCAPGSVRVDRARRIDAHAGSVWQATAEVSGVLMNGWGPRDLLAATFPPGSVTGAPKVRATQIIAELEPVARGFYCGAAGVLNDDGSLDLNVAIRTVQLVRQDAGEFPGPGRYALRFSVGAGIVADSDPDAEWAETMDKAEVLVRTLGANPGTPHA